MELKSRKPTCLYEGPIPAPLGFEGADMKAPKDWETDDKFIPLTTEPRPAQGTLPPKFQAMNDKAKAKKDKPQSSAEELIPSPVSPASEERKTSTSRSMIALLIVVVTGLLWFFRLLFKPRK